MSIGARLAAELQSLAANFEAQAERTKPTFTDETRPKFDHYVTAAMKGEISSLASSVSRLDAELTSALRLLD